MAREFSESSVETAATEHVSATPAHAEAHSYSEPARETSAPSFSAYGLDDEAEESSKSKKPYFIVAAIVVAGGMAFYGWTMKHSSSSPTPATVAPAATTPTETVPAQPMPSPSTARAEFAIEHAGTIRSRSDSYFAFRETKCCQDTSGCGRHRDEGCSSSRQGTTAARTPPQQRVSPLLRHPVL